MGRARMSIETQPTHRLGRGEAGAPQRGDESLPLNSTNERVKNIPNAPQFAYHAPYTYVAAHLVPRPSQLAFVIHAG